MFKPNSSFIVLYTENVSKTHDFYSKLGCEIKELKEDKVVVTVADFDLHFIDKTTEPHPDYLYVTEPTYGQGAIFYFEVEDIKDFEQQVRSAGGTIIVPVFTNHWDSQEMLFEDPTGFKFAAYQ